jgi:predicted kinase
MIGAVTVVLMCGIAGSGKTTYGQGEAAGYVRLSIDEELWRRFGPCDAAAFPVRRDVVGRDPRVRLVMLVQSGRDLVVDNSFWRRSDRDSYTRRAAAR